MFVETIAIGVVVLMAICVTTLLIRKKRATHAKKYSNGNAIFANNDFRKRVFIIPLHETPLIASKSASLSASNYQQNVQSVSAIPLFQDQYTKYQVTLLEKEPINYNTCRFRFQLPTPRHTLGHFVCQHILLCAIIDNRQVIRPYTPVSNSDELGYFDLAVKIYFKHANSRFSEGGKMSQHLFNMKIGDSILIKGNFGKITYHQNGLFLIKHDRKSAPVPRHVDRVNFIVGGTGITPVMQFLKALFKNREDTLCVRLLYANKTPQDILFREELNYLQTVYSAQFRVWYTVDKAPDKGWQYSRGFVNLQMIEDHLFCPCYENCLVFMCGPPTMINLQCLKTLRQLGYKDDICYVL